MIHTANRQGCRESINERIGARICKDKHCTRETPISWSYIIVNSFTLPYQPGCPLQYPGGKEDPSPSVVGRNGSISCSSKNRKFSQLWINPVTVSLRLFILGIG